MDNSEKLKALDAAISKIEKDFVKGAIMKRFSRKAAAEKKEDKT